MDGEALNELFCQRRLWQGSRTPAGERGLASGFPELDGILPYGGWPRGAVMEAAVSDWGIGELSLFLPLMAHYHQDQHYVTWVAPPHAPYPPALAAAGLDLSLCRVLRNPEEDRQILWCAEKLLQNSACGLVLAWPGTLTDRAVRRLQLAAEGSEALCVLWRRQDHKPAWDAAPASLRLRLSRAEAGLALEVVKARGTCRYPRLVLDL